MRARPLFHVTALLSLGALIGCGMEAGSDIPALDVDQITAVLVPGANARPLKLNHHQMSPVWTVSKDQELACGGAAIAGGEVGGKGNFTHLGESSVDVSAAWDIGHLIQTPPRYTPVGPASGPVAPVVGQSGYPYAFHRDPNSGDCQQTVEATGKVVLTAANGDQLYGDITGGEAFKMDFVIDGDGVESFAEVAVTGGTGRFAGATGSFVVHLIARVQPTLKFAITLAEIMPGGTLGY
jgi:hypothetical protein